MIDRENFYRKMPNLRLIEHRFVAKFLIFVFMFNGMMLKASAQDHLSPDIPYVIGIDDYSIKLKNIFSEGLTRGVLLRALVIPSFSPEYMTGIRKKGESYESFVIESCSVISDDSVSKVHANSCKDPSDKVQISIRAIPKELSLALIEIWKESLLGVKYPEKPTIMLDGTSFHLSMFLEKYGDISGVFLSPKKDTKLETLSKIISSLVKYSQNELDDRNFERLLNSFQS